MLQLVVYLLFLLNLSLVLAATAPAKTPQSPPVDTPIDIPDRPSNISDAAVQHANITSYGGRQIGCFAQRGPGLKQLETVRAMDCYTNMARGLLLGDGVMERGIWSAANLPFVYTAASCAIILDAVAPDAIDYFSEAEIAHAAATIAFPCIANNDDPLGGRTHVGGRGVFTVTIFGRKL